MNKQTLSKVREFNRFYVVELNVFNKYALGTSWSLVEGRIIGEIGRNQGCLAQELAEELQMDKSYLSRILGKLETAGLLRRVVSETDSRKKHLYLTEVGLEAFEELEVRSDAQAADQLAGLDELEQQQVLACMEYLLRTLGKKVSGEEAAVVTATARNTGDAEKPGDSRRVELVPGYDRLDEVKELFQEYTDYIIRWVPEVREILQAQHIDDEMADITAKYGMPCGRLYLALVDGRAEGCIALRKLTDEICEMKRLYVRDGFKGLHIGRRLAEQIIADAREIGYEYMRLDTLPVMKPAIGLYKSLGFYEIGKYYENPGKDNIYMELKL